MSDRGGTISLQFEGEFETHLTILLGDDQGEAVRFLKSWAAEREMRYVHIVLARGQTPSQPMLTRRSVGTLDDAMRQADAVRTALSEDGFQVTRIKIEAAPDNSDVPRLDDDARTQSSPDRHYEHHVKLILDASSDRAALALLAERHGAHVSRNALKVRADGCEERFVTQRCHRVGRSTARRALDALHADLTSAGFAIIDVEQEYVVYDSNAALDAGWLSPSGEG